MAIDRRRFLQGLTGALAFLAARSGNASAQGGAALAIHRATRNTRLGALGTRLRSLGGQPGRRKAYAGLARLALPEAAAEDGRPLAQVVRDTASTPVLAAGPLPLEELATLLHLTNGVTRPAGPAHPGPPLRAAPSAGALYAGEVYVVAERVRDLPRGVYYYDVEAHALVRLRGGPAPGALALALEAPADVERAAFAVLLTNVFARYEWRYANRGYRYALIDSGHIGENLRLAARARGLAERAPLRFEDDALNALLGIDGLEEAVCAVHLVGSRSASGAEGPSPASRPWTEKRLRSDLAPAQGRPSQRYHDATRLVPAAGAAVEPHAGRPAPPPTRSFSEPAVGLPRLAAGPTASVGEAIRVRRSARRFEPGPLDLARLGWILEAARGTPDLERAPGIDLLLVAHRVTDLAPGLYRYEPRAHALRAIRPARLDDELVRACLGQEKAGAAALGLLLAARLEQAVRRGGERAYRDLLLQAGAVAQRVYLAAEAAGLAARNLAAFLDDDVNDLAGLDGQREAVVHLTMVGPGD